MPEPRGHRLDQASGLRQLFRRRGVRVLPIAAASERRRDLTGLALALAACGERVLLLDHGWSEAARRGGGRNDLAAILRGDLSLQQAASEIGSGTRSLAVGEGFALMNQAGISAAQLFAALNRIDEPVELVLLATAQPRSVAEILDSRAEFVVLASPSASGIASGYQMVKSIATRGATVRLVFEGVDRQTVADAAFRRIEQTARRFLGVVPLHGGALPRESLGAVQRGHPSGTAARAIERLARAALSWGLLEYPCPVGAEERSADAPAHTGGPDMRGRQEIEAARTRQPAVL